MKKVLIANRGEIAVRIIKTLRRMDIRSVAVYSEPDSEALFVKMADEAVALGGKTAQESYLRVDKIMEACQITGADAIHPGYGFLSEKLELLRACDKAGVIFIGPKEKAIQLMGDKIESKKLMLSGGVPTIPGFFVDGMDLVSIQQHAESIGYPVMVKAAAGGGGKGLRRVDREEDLAQALESCQSEALRSFNDDRVFVEKYILNPRHIEVQVFGDSYGLVVGLSERECSIQRRNQKVIEECPSTGVDSDLRQALCQAAANCARLVDYQNAGTVEFVMGEDKSFYFLEMNTRLQVEHPVTEMAHGIDLVEEQIRVAQGLPLSKELIGSKPIRWSLECRIYAEEPLADFFPCAGRILKLRFPEESEWLRVDTGVVSGDDISIYYDPMIAKVITVADTRAEAVYKMIQALAQVSIFGIETNVGFLLEVLRSEEFSQGLLSTDFIQKYDMVLRHKNTLNSEVNLVAHAAFHVSQRGRGGKSLESDVFLKGGSR